jgi:hypothetical protein
LQPRRWQDVAGRQVRLQNFSKKAEKIYFRKKYQKGKMSGWVAPVEAARHPLI